MPTLFARKPSHVTVPLAWLLVYLFLVQGALPSLVLCFGGGGHVAVERPHSPDNHASPQSQAPCLDVLLFMEKPEEQTRVVASSSALQAIVSVLGIAATFVQPFTLSWRPSILPPVACSAISSLVLLHPVILRI
jgi:hypothetical protein